MGSGGSKKRVCIIGAGPSGLVALKEFSKNTEVFDIVCFEQASDLGGVWNYSDLTTYSATLKRTSVYKNLIVNRPKEFFAFSDIPFEENVPSFPHHSEIKKYLSNYAQTHKLQKLIKFNTRVTCVKPKKQDRRDVWHLETLNMQNKKTDSCQFDILIVCIGANVQAHMPNTKGLRDFKGKVVHSQEYRDPVAFKNKSVLLVGSGPGAKEISMDLSPHVKKVYLSHKLEENLKIPDSIEQIGEVLEFTKKGVICQKSGPFKPNELSSKDNDKNDGNEKKDSGESSGDEEEPKKNFSENKIDDMVRKISRGLSINNDKKGSKHGSSSSSDNESEDKKDGDKQNKSDDESSSTVVKKNKKKNKRNVSESSESSDNDQNPNKTKENDSEEKVESITIEQIDAVIFCSGYDYSFSFLSADCGVAVISDKVVGPLYKDMICIGKQTLSFVGINTSGTSFLFESQAKFLKAFYEEKIKIPPYGSELLSMIRKDDKKKISKKVDIVHRPLQIKFYQWKYMKNLASIAGFEPVDEKYEKLFKESCELARENYAKYRKTNFVLGSDGFYEAKIKEEDVTNGSEK